ncbi:MAG: GHMP kinase [Salinibacter sp.]
MSVTAYAPGSVTTLFVPRDGRSSLGVSFATADGAAATVEPAAEPVVYLDGREADVAPVAGVLRRLGTPAAVHLRTDVPIGCGFGVSGAATLAAALAVNEAEGLGHDRNTLVEAAHRAEVEAGTGLGDVFIQDRGGLVWDRGTGLRHADCTAVIGYSAFGDISTAAVLGDEAAMRRVARIGREVLADLDPTDGLGPLFEASWDFATRAGLSTDRVEDTVASVRDDGGVATMAMVGESVVAVGAEAALDQTTRVTSAGAALR